MKKSTKNIIKSIVVLCFIVLLFDVFYIIYQKQSNLPESNYFDSMNHYAISDHSYIAVGSNNDNDHAYEKAKITKYDEKFNKVWEKFYNRGFNSTFYHIAIDDDGFVAVGNFQRTKKERSEKTTTALLVKYDEEGKEEFHKTLQILGNSTFKSVVVVDDGYIAVGQSIYENSTLGMSDEGGAIIVKYDKTGKVLWQDHYGGNKSGLYNDLIIADDTIYAVGKDYGRVGIISKYNLDGERLDTKTYQYTDTLGFTGITQIDDELVVVGAKKIHEDEYDHDIDGLVVKYDYDLDVIDTVIYQDSGLERFNTVTHDSENNLILVGHQAVLDKRKSTKTKNVYQYYGLLAKYKDNLKEVYVERYGDGNNDYFTNISIVEDHYLVSGYSKYKKQGYFSKFVTYSPAGKMLEVK